MKKLTRTLCGQKIFPGFFEKSFILMGTKWLVTLQKNKLFWLKAHSELCAGPILICQDYCPTDISKSLLIADIRGHISGLFYLNGKCDDLAPGPYPIIKNTQNLMEHLISRNVKDVIFIENKEHDPIAEGVREKLLPDLLTLPTRLWLAVNLQREFSIAVRHKAEHYKLVPIVNENLVHSTNKVKRIFDLVIGSILLLFCLPILAFTAMLVRVSGPGPVIFRQIRAGAQGKVFKVLKFRTMVAYANDHSHQTTRIDPRVTKIGRFLRRTSLDELLQLINVIKGDMSLVGPRPHAVETKVQGILFEDAITFYRRRYRVKPGITGLAQIRGQRGETKVIEKLEQRIISDLKYIEKWSIWLDILIIICTIPVFFTQKNAY